MSGRRLTTHSSSPRRPPCAYTHARKHARTRAHTHARAHAHARTRARALTHTHAHTHTHTQPHTHARSRTHAHTHRGTGAPRPTKQADMAHERWLALAGGTGSLRHIQPAGRGTAPAPWLCTCCRRVCESRVLASRTSYCRAERRRVTTEHSRCVGAMLLRICLHIPVCERGGGEVVTLGCKMSERAKMVVRAGGRHGRALESPATPAA